MRTLGERGTAPTWLWTRIRDDVREGRERLRAGRRTWRRLSLLAASVMLVLGAFAWFGPEEDRMQDFAIVRVSFADLQPLPHPAAVLRRGGLR